MGTLRALYGKFPANSPEVHSLLWFDESVCFASFLASLKWMNAFFHNGLSMQLTNAYATAILDANLLTSTVSSAHRSKLPS